MSWRGQRYKSGAKGAKLRRKDFQRHSIEWARIRTKLNRQICAARINGARRDLARIERVGWNLVELNGNARISMCKMIS